MGLGALFRGINPKKTPMATAVPASLNMHIVSTNLAKTLVCKREYDVILWHNKQRISSNIDHHTPLLNTTFWRESNQAVTPGITRPLHATGYNSEPYSSFYIQTKSSQIQLCQVKIQHTYPQKLISKTEHGTTVGKE